MGHRHEHHFASGNSLRGLTRAAFIIALMTASLCVHARDTGQPRDATQARPANPGQPANGTQARDAAQARITPQAAPTAPAAPAAASERGSGTSSRDTVGAGDSIRITVFQNPDLTTEARLSQGGA